MHHLIVTRVSIVLAVVCGGAALLFAWATGLEAPVQARAMGGESAPAAASTQPGARLFKLHCSACHTLEETAAVLLQEPDSQTRARQMLALLAEHGGADQAEDRIIVEHLQKLARANRQ